MIHGLSLSANVRVLTDVFDALSKLRQPAGKQLLLYHESAGSSAILSERSDFNSFLNSLGYPSELRKVAISNGSGIGWGVRNNSNNFINPGDQILNWDKWNILFNIKGNAWSLPVLNTQKIFDGKIGLSATVGLIYFPIGFAAWALVRKSSTVTFVGGSFCYDIMPGGEKNLPEFITDKSPGGNMGNITTNTNDVCHIPLFSALGLPISFTSNIAANHQSAVQASPFDELYYSPNENEEHIHFSTKTREDVFRELIPADLVVNEGWEEGSIRATNSIYVSPGFKSKREVPGFRVEYKVFSSKGDFLPHGRVSQPMQRTGAQGKLPFCEPQNTEKGFVAHSRSRMILRFSLTLKWYLLGRVPSFWMKLRLSISRN